MKSVKKIVSVILTCVFVLSCMSTMTFAFAEEGETTQESQIEEKKIQFSWSTGITDTKLNSYTSGNIQDAQDWGTWQIENTYAPLTKVDKTLKAPTMYLTSSDSASDIKMKYSDRWNINFNTTLASGVSGGKTPDLKYAKYFAFDVYASTEADVANTAITIELPNIGKIVSKPISSYQITEKALEGNWYRIIKLRV